MRSRVYFKGHKSNWFDILQGNRQGWVLYRVDEEENYKHLGFINNKYLNLKPSINDATNKLKGTFFSLIKSGIFYQDTLHPYRVRKFTMLLYYPKLYTDVKTGQACRQLS